MPLVGVVMGSNSDAETLQPALDILEQFNIEHEVNVISAHRTPEKAKQYAQNARERGLEVIIAAAGLAAQDHSSLMAGRLMFGAPPDGGAAGGRAAMPE